MSLGGACCSLSQHDLNSHNGNWPKTDLNTSTVDYKLQLWKCMHDGSIFFKCISQLVDGMLYVTSREVQCWLLCDWQEVEGFVEWELTDNIQQLYIFIIVK